MDGDPLPGEYLGPGNETVRVFRSGESWTCVIVSADRRSATARRLTLDDWRTLTPAATPTPVG